MSIERTTLYGVVGFLCGGAYVYLLCYGADAQGLLAAAIVLLMLSFGEMTG